MAKLAVDGATLCCSMGNAPSRLSVLPACGVAGGGCPAASIQDIRPSLNIAPFGLCSAPTNPQVAAATAAAMGTLTPQPCVPMTAGPWTPGSQSVTVDDQPALTDACQCTCQWGGAIQVQDAGQTDSEID
jgi:hypothetical protein